MKKLLLIIAILLSSTTFAQLTVKPTLTSDSYIYVKDQVLFVNDYIDLTINPSPGVEASIYLRENAQLIQGGVTSTNYGNGQLSVQQNTPESNAWAYYYWCPPISHPAVAAGNRSFGITKIYEDINPVIGI